MADEESSSCEFRVAAAHARACLADLGDEDMLKIYGLYKQANEGPCNKAKPYFWDFVAKSKWEAWKSVGQITKEDAMVKYVQLIKQLDPSFDPNSEVKNVPTKQGMGIAVSKMFSENEEEINEEAKTIFDWCKEGNSDKVNSMLSDNIEAAQQKDEQGLTLLHWACDRGHPEIVSILLKAGANVNAQDEELLTPLHYAATCEREDLVSILLEAGSDRSIKDDSGQTPSECADSISLRNLIDGYSSALT